MQDIIKHIKSDFKGALEQIFGFCDMEEYDDEKFESVFGIRAQESSFKEETWNNLYFRLSPIDSNKRSDLVQKTKELNKNFGNHNIIFFHNENLLHICFAKRRVNKSEQNKDVIEQITIIKDIDINHISHAHSLNLQAIKEINNQLSIQEYYEEILEKLSIDGINERFLKDIRAQFSEFESALILPEDSNNKPQIKREFILRLFARILFCKFLEKKGAIDSCIWQIDNDYYHSVLEPLFFETLNTPQNERKYHFIDDKIKNYLAKIPYLNGGLFSPKNEDYYKGNFRNDVKIPDEQFSSFFNMLDKYHFTIDECTPYAHEVGLDPELLGMIFETLLKNLHENQDLRKASGSFYTPREIVDFMCKNAILEALKQNLDSKMHSDIEKLILKEDSNIGYKKEISSALKKLTILDPACGSGAFPIGILNEMIRIQERLGDLGDIGKRKLEILENNIFGIDIQAMATEIARLRCFLSLIIDTQIDNKKENLGLIPLPNLEFKFISANALIKLNLNERGLESEETTRLKNELEMLRNKFFIQKDIKEKENLKKQYQNTQKKLALSSDFSNEIANKLIDWNPFDTHSVAEFFDSEFMFGIKNFDIVIGNPPYIQLQKMKDEAKKYAKYSSYSKMGDIYQLFFENALHLLNKNGIASFITSNKFMRAGYGETTREYFYKNANILFVLDLGAGRFKSATVDTSICQYCKLDSKPQIRQAKATRFKGTLNELKNTKFRDDTITIDNKKQWVIMNSLEKSIFDKVNKHKPLKDWDVQIYRGVLTGYNEAFIIDEDTKNRLIEEDEKSKEIIKPILRGRDIKRYSYEFKNLYLITTFPALKLNINNYPAVKKYLKSFGKRLEQSGEKGCRKKTNNKWFETQDTISYYKDFEKEKIVYQEICKEASYALDEHKIFVNNTGYIMTSEKYNLKVLLSILNSKLGWWFFTKHNMILGSSGVRMLAMYIEKFPAPKIENKDLINNIESLATQLIQNHAKKIFDKSLDKKLDNLIYELYDLSPNEINLIESEFNNAERERERERDELIDKFYQLLLDSNRFMPKIIWNRIASEISFCYEDRGFFILDSAFMITCEDEKITQFLCGILNSNLIKFYLKNNAASLGDGMYGAKIYVENVPIPPFCESIWQLSKKIIANPSDSKLQNELNSQIAKLYNLNAQEIAYINN